MVARDMSFGALPWQSEMLHRELNTKLMWLFITM
jgi:hypothetical protein